jgi:transposase-like protein
MKSITAYALPAPTSQEAGRPDLDQQGESGRGLVPAGPPRPNPEVAARPTRRRFTAEYKQRILVEADRAKATPGATGALLRREGLYSSHLVDWRRTRAAGIRQALTPQPRGPKPTQSPLVEENAQLRRENQRLTEHLRKAELVIDVQKKVAALLGRALPDPEIP